MSIRTCRIASHLTCLVVAILTLQESLGFVVNDASRRSYYSGTTTTTALFSDPDKTSIGDQVLNLHGGKYRFDDAAMNAVGEEFAQSLYSSSKQEKEEIPEYKDWPNWAKKMGPTTSNMEALVVDEKGTTVRVTNEYRTWEPYFAKIIKMNDDSLQSEKPHCQQGPFQIVGGMGGTLAPKGGSDNVCDANQPYPDWAVVTVKHVGGSPQEDPSYVLVVGTEEEKWYYKLLA